MICPKCKKEIPAGSNICPVCYADLTKIRLSAEPQGEGAPRRGNAPRGEAGAYRTQGTRRRPGAQPNMQALMVAGGLVIVFLVLLVWLLRMIFGGGQGAQPPVLNNTPEPSPTFQIFGVVNNTPAPTVEPDPLDGIELNVTPEPTATPEPVYVTLKKGSKGDDVKRLQEALIALNYLDDNGADGDYGNATVSAVKKFQTDNGLSADGQAGQQTLTTIYRLYGGDIDNQPAEPSGTTGGTGGSVPQILDQPG